MELPKIATIELNESQRFLIGFKELCAETGMNEIDYCKLGLQVLKFKDGSSIGVRALMNNVGFNWER